MRIQPGDLVIGLPVLAIRKLLKYVQRLQGGTLETIAEQLEVDAPSAAQIYQRLLSEGYIEPSEPVAGNESWHLTWKGSALANASTRKPITRKTAERLVEEFLARVREINASDYAYRVGRVIVFGSFLSDAPTLGDVDLSIELVDPYQDTREREAAHQARIAAAENEGRSFRDYMEMLRWPEQEVLLKLKNRSPSLSLHYEWREQVLSRPIPSRIIFDAAWQENAGDGSSSGPVSASGQK
jgi:hypothetical protein